MDSVQQHFFKNIDKTLIQDFILTMFGPESKNLADNFTPSKELLMQYKYNILNNQDSILNGNILDIGCNTGLWMLVSLLHGANSVVGIEPREMYVNGFNNFCTKHNLQGKMIKGTDLDIKTALDKNKIDTVFAFSVTHMLFDFNGMISCIQQAGVENVLMQVIDLEDRNISVSDQNIDKSKICGITLHLEEHNATLRSSMNRTNLVKASQTGMQTQLHDLNLNNTVSYKNIHSIGYIKTVMSHHNFVLIQDDLQPYPIPSSSSTMRAGKFRWLKFANKS